MFCTVFAYGPFTHVKHCLKNIYVCIYLFIQEHSSHMLFEPPGCESQLSEERSFKMRAASKGDELVLDRDWNKESFLKLRVMENVSLEFQSQNVELEMSIMCPL